MSNPALIVTGADLAPQALDLLTGFEIVYAGKTPTEADMVALCQKHDPVAIIVPCHRVLASDGSLGGYSLGLSMKRRLLALEGVSVAG